MDSVTAADRFDYKAIKKLAKEQGCSIQDFLALDRKNDPFYVGAPFELQRAHWFADVFKKLGYDKKSGVTHRRVHYALQSLDPPVLKPDGKPYENTDSCWHYLSTASGYARDLGLIDPDVFIDVKASAPYIFANRDQDSDPEPGIDLDSSSFDDLFSPYLPALPGIGSLPDLPMLYASGFDDIQQRYHVEIWIEKTTMNDILVPLCQSYKINLITGEGEFSKIAAREFMKRAQDAGKPARILYISDFDPAGNGMPIHLARKVEFYQRSGEFETDEIKVIPVMLTAEQVKKYDLPRKPIKVNKKVSRTGRPNAYLKRIETFEAIHGAGATELDALEAIHEGEMSRIIEAEIKRYFDTGLVRKARLEKQRLQDALDGGSWATHAHYSDELDDLEREYQALVTDFAQTRNEFSEAIKTFQPRIDQYRERLEGIKEQGAELYSDIEDDLENAPIDTDDYPLPEPDIAGDPRLVLFDSSRDYLDQIEVYKSWRDGNQGQNGNGNIEAASA